MSAPTLHPEASRSIAHSVLSDADLRLIELPPALDVVPDLIPEGVTTFYAEPGLGKSFLSQSLEHYLTYGIAFGIWEAQDPIRALVIDLEGDLALTQERGFSITPFGTLPTDRGEADNGGGLLDHAVESGTTRVGWPGRDITERYLHLTVALEEAIRVGNPYRYVRIDTLRAFVGGCPRGTNPYDWDQLWIGNLNKLAKELKVGILLIHHTNKAGVISGSQAISGSGEATIRLIRNPDNEHECFFESEKVRRVAPFRHALIQGPGGVWEFTDRISAGQARNTGSCRAVLDALATHGPMTMQELRGVLHMSPTTIKGAKDRLTRKGLVRYFHGAYEAVGQLPPATAADPQVHFCSVCTYQMTVIQEGQTMHPSCVPADAPDPEDQEPEYVPEEPADVWSGVRSLQASIGAAKRYAALRVPKADRESGAWALMSEHLDGHFTPGWELGDYETAAGQLVAVLDRNGSYPSVCGSVTVAAQLLKHTGPLEERGKTAGIYQITAPVWDDPWLPHPLGRIMQTIDADGRVWVTTPHLIHLTRLADPNRDPMRGRIAAVPTIHDSWTAASTTSLFEPFAKDVQAARESGRAASPEEYVRVKRSSSQALRLLWPKGARSPWWRPDWSLSVRAEAAIRHWQVAANARYQGATLIRLGMVDEAVFLAPAGSDASWAPAPYRIGTGYGQVKHSDHVLIEGEKIPSPLTVDQWQRRGRRAKR